MNRLSKHHIIVKTIWQIFLVIIEIGIIAGGLTWGSSYLWSINSGLDAIERFSVFYGVYQLIVYIILSTLNDIESDEYLALMNAAMLAAKACEFNDNNTKNSVYILIERQLKTDVFNDLNVRDKYHLLKQFTDSNNLRNIEYLIIWSSHCFDASKLQWKYSFILRLLK